MFRGLKGFLVFDFGFWELEMIFGGDGLCEVGAELCGE